MCQPLYVPLEQHDANASFEQVAQTRFQETHATTGALSLVSKPRVRSWYGDHPQASRESFHAQG